MNNAQRFLTILAADNATIVRLLDTHSHLGPVGELRAFVVDAPALERGPLGVTLQKAGVGALASDDDARRLFVLPRADARRLVAGMETEIAIPADFLESCGAQLAPGVLRVVAFLGSRAMTCDALESKVRAAAGMSAVHGAVARAVAAAAPQTQALDAIPPASSFLLPRPSLAPAPELGVDGTPFLLGSSPLG